MDNLSESGSHRKAKYLGGTQDLPLRPSSNQGRVTIQDYFKDKKSNKGVLMIKLLVQCPAFN